MTLTARARRRVFWLEDRARGSRIRPHYLEVRTAMAERYGGGERPLRALLDHAVGSTPFYRPYTGRDLAEMPVVSKSLIRDDPGRFHSSAYVGASLHAKTTSGSTGEPFTIVQDATKRRRVIGETLAFNEMAGLSIGGHLVWVRSAQLLPMTRTQRWIRNITPVDHVGLDDREREDIVRLLRKGSGTGVVSPSSALASLAEYVERHGYPADGFRLSGIISIAEDLQPAMRRRIEAAFGCTVTNRYSNQENGMLATSRRGHNGFELNRASYRFEFLKLDSDEPQAPGELARVVITDLFNRAMPLIRYDGGDLAIVSEVDDEGQAVALSSIEGRRVDVIHDTSGGRISSTWAADVISTSFPQVRRYQLIQEGKRSYRLKVVLGEATYETSDLVAELRKWLGADAEIAVEFVNDIPRAASGKYRAVINRVSS